MAKVHHSAIGTRDVAASLTFWRDGLGFEVQMDERFAGDWAGLFGGEATQLRSVLQGDPAAPDTGVVELVEMPGLAPPTPQPPAPAEGFFLLSLFADLDEVLPRLAALGLGGPPRVVAVHGVRLAVVHDPNGVRVELMDNTARSNVTRLAAGQE
jgi:catechol 2,3-dioxygenase-like lactoylglutathione lyase family enzyme